MEAFLEEAALGNSSLKKSIKLELARTIRKHFEGRLRIVGVQRLPARKSFLIFN